MTDERDELAQVIAENRSSIDANDYEVAGAILAAGWRRIGAELDRALANPEPEPAADVWKYAKEGNPSGWGDMAPINAEDVAYWQGRGYNVFRRSGAMPWEPVPVETDDEGES